MHGPLLHPSADAAEKRKSAKTDTFAEEKEKRVKPTNLECHRTGLNKEICATENKASVSHFLTGNAQYRAKPRKFD